MENTSRDLTTEELVEAGYDPIKAKRVDALRERAARLGGRVRVQRWEGGYLYGVEGRTPKEDALWVKMLEDAEQRIVGLEEGHREP
jgi:hypothetical protein